MNARTLLVIGAVAVVIVLVLRARRSNENPAISPPRSEIFDMDQRSTSMGTAQSDARASATAKVGGFDARFNARIGL